MKEAPSENTCKGKAYPEDLFGGPGRPTVSLESLPPGNRFHGKRHVDGGHRGSVSQIKEYEGSNSMDLDHPRKFYSTGLMDRKYLKRQIGLLQTRK